MADISVTIKGPDLTALIRQSNARIEANTEDALDEIAASTVVDAASACPVSPKRKPHLRDDIQLVNKAKLMRRIGTTFLYGPFVELGTSKMSARPFLFPAFERNRAKLLAKLRAMKVTT